MPASHRQMVLEAFLYLGLARLAILIIPFRTIAPYLGQLGASTPESTEPLSQNTARQVSWAVSTASRHTPWQSRCLAQAIAAKMMLRRRGLASTLYLGLKKAGEKSLDAHAWLRYGDIILTGGESLDMFTVISTFA